MAVTGFVRPPSVVDVPHFLKARTPKALVEAMLKNNMKLKGYVSYFDIQFAEGSWYAWYLVDYTKSLDGK